MKTRLPITICPSYCITALLALSFVTAATLVANSATPSADSLNSSTPSVTLASDTRIDWPLPTPPAGTNSAIFPAPNNPWMTKFLANKERAAKGNVDLLFIGDSISEGWKNTGSAVFAESFPKDRTATFGISADRTENMLWRMRHGEMDGIAPKVIVILAGTNNVNRNSVEEIAEGITALVNECRHLSPQSQIILLAIFPRSANTEAPWRKKLMEVNALIAPLGERDNVTFLDIGSTFLLEDGAMNRDLMPDLLHPNRAGYQAWVDAMRPTLSRHLELPAPTHAGLP